MTKIDKTEQSSDTAYKHGFVTKIRVDTIARGLNESVVRQISKKKNEPAWMCEWRLDAFRKWKKMNEPHWAVDYAPIDYQKARYYSAPKNLEVGQENRNAIDDELTRTFERLGIPLDERVKGVAVDAVFDSVSVKTTHQEELKKSGVIFCAISEAIRDYPDLVQKYLGAIVPKTDNYFAALNSAVFSDGSFVYIPKGVRCPLDLSTYFRINAADTGQFERTLIIADDHSFVNYIEGCTAPARSSNQLHAAVVELITLDHAEIKYSTVQNWYGGDADGRGGIYNFVTKRGRCQGDHSKISWTQVEAGSSHTWKYPGCVLKGDYSQGSFYSVAVTNNRMQADTGTKMIHLGKNTKSTIISKGISADDSKNAYRGLVSVKEGAIGARNYTQCDSMLIGDRCTATTLPSIEVSEPSAVVEHEATTSKLSADQVFYLASRGLDPEAVISMLINGFCKEVFRELPLEFAVEAQKLLQTKLENSVG